MVTSRVGPLTEIDRFALAVNGVRTGVGRGHRERGGSEGAGRPADGPGGAIESEAGRELR